MNREWVLFHLRETRTSIDTMIKNIETTPDYGWGELSVEMGHIYEHVNMATNSWNESDARVRECSEEDYERWRKFPAGTIYVGE